MTTRSIWHKPQPKNETGFVDLAQHRVTTSLAACSFERTKIVIVKNQIAAFKILRFSLCFRFYFLCIVVVNMFFPATTPEYRLKAVPYERWCKLMQTDALPNEDEVERQQAKGQQAWNTTRGGISMAGNVAEDARDAMGRKVERQQAPKCLTLARDSYPP